MKLRYLAPAMAELRDALAWYSTRNLTAARHFNAEVVVAEGLLCAHPRIGKHVGNEARSLCVNDFPYTLFYLIEHDEIIIIAVAHHSCKPGYWMSRMR